MASGVSSVLDQSSYSPQHTLTPQESSNLLNDLRQLKVAYLGFRNNLEVELLVDEGGAGLAQVALVGDETGSAKAARTAQLVHPLRPLGVEPAVRLLILRLEHTYSLL